MITNNEATQQNHKRYRVLVVDDMATSRMLVRAALNSSEYDILEAGNGESALQLLRNLPIDVVLLNVNMPDLSGFEVCKRIRQIEGLKFLPVIMLTSDEDTDSIVQGMNSGATDYLTKPFHPNELIARLAVAAERNRLSEELVMARRAAESASQSKSMFLVSMSHEIRIPMNVIIGLSHLCLQTCLNKTQRNYVEKINHAAKSLLDIINDVLDFSRIEAGKLELMQEDFDLRTCLGKVDSLIGYLAREKNLDFIIATADKVPYFLHGDAVRLGQVLINLTSNAVKFTEKGSVTLTISMESSIDNQIKLRFSVHDTGIGLNPKQIDRLFESYQQADSTTYHKYGGSGLGLTICRQLVELMGGKIWVESELGHGSTFYFTACLGHGKETETTVLQQATKLLSAQEKLKKARILVVEDNPFNQLVIEDLLELTGATTVTANNGQEALECLAAESFDLVLMDIQMPIMDGLEATRLIRENPKFSSVCIIAMTGNVTLDNRNRCLALGMDDFIPKPIDPNQMYLTLAKWITDRTEKNSKAEESNSALHQELPPVNITMLYQMFYNNTALVRKFGMKFIEVADETVAEMLTARTEKDLVALGRLGHKLKSSAKIIGASSFANLCEALERANNNNDWNSAEALLDEIPPLLEKISSQLKNEFIDVDQQQ